MVKCECRESQIHVTCSPFEKKIGKMSAMQIVFLFDLNAFNEDIFKSETDLHKKLLCLRLTCIRILTHYSTISPHLKWGFKFFDSNGPLTQIMYKFSFPSVTLESFEILESEICIKYQRHISYLGAISESVKHNSSSPADGDNTSNENGKTSPPIQLLQLALTQLLFEYPWNDNTELFSPSTKHRNNKNIKKRNMLFLVSKCAASEHEFLNYFGVTISSINKKKFDKVLLSQSLHEKLIDKASILWVWLNTSERKNFLGSSKSDSLNLLADTLHSFQGSLIPLCVLSQPNNILKINKSQMDQQFENSATSYTSIVPFSTSFCQSIVHPFYLGTQESCNEAQIVLLGNANKIPVTLTKMECSRKENGLFYKAREFQKNNRKVPSLKSNTSISSTTWSKITIQFAVTVHLPLKANDMFLCLPGPKSTRSSYKNLQSIIRSLLLKNASLFVVCESVCGLTSPGIFSTLSETSAMISILNPKDCFLNKADISTDILDSTKSPKVFNASNSGPFCIDKKNTIENSEEISGKCDLKPFQMECMETWFESNSSVSKVVIDHQDNHKSSEFEVFHNKLKLFGTRYQRDKKKTSENPPKETESVVESEEVKQEENFDEICKELTYEKLISLLTETYDSALRTNGMAIHIAKKIIKLASTFFLQKSIISYEESTKSFMVEYFCTNSRKLIEKYGINQDAENAAKGINECQLQTALALEMEALFPSENYAGCVKNITSLLGVMSFFSGATELSKFLSEVLMENYGNNLYDLLVEIGEELGIPVVPEEDSEEDPMEAPNSSASLSEIFGSVLSSNLSVSSSSTSSKSDNRKLVRKRSDICDTNKSRQVLLPGKSPKKKKNKTSSSAVEKKSVRYSPRLASKRKRERCKAAESKTGSVRRNLFSRDKKLQTPRTSKFSTTPSKKKTQTPQAHHVLKTNYVPNTPAHKQNKSALQRRKSQMDLPAVGENVEVAESPTVRRSSKDSENFKLLQKLKENNNTTLASDQMASQSEGCSYRTQHTPESKRRLSLKLFSKLLASPTARMGLKKCSKRLFEQVTPHTFSEPRKRMKFCFGPGDAEET